MKIAKIKVRNFKSFHNQEISFHHFSILVGGNASGKSNIISLFKFISNLIKYGLDEAISALGGMDALVNTAIGNKETTLLRYEIDFHENEIITKKTEESITYLQVEQVIFELEIKSGDHHLDYEVLKDELTIKYHGYDNTANQYGSFTLTTNKGMDSISQVGYQASSNPIDEMITRSIQEDEIFLNDFSAYFLRILKSSHDVSIKSLPFIIPEFVNCNHFVKIYDFNPKDLKKPSSLTSFKSLDEHGLNLASILYHVIKRPKEEERLLDILADCLPFIEKIYLENGKDQSVSYVVQETYSNRRLHASNLSDGTVVMLTMIIALYFDEPTGVIALEEPERSLHPKLLKKLLAMVRDVSTERQVIMTTHNPELLKHCPIEAILFAKRQKDGFTTILYPENSESVRVFLDQELGLDDLFIQDLLGD
ncbi:MAG: AAA family ATPase [Bacilli bacterium]|jgi:predicted ATPase